MAHITPECEQSAREMGPQSDWPQDWPMHPSRAHALLSHEHVVARAWGGDDEAKAMIVRCYGCAVLNEIVDNTH